MSRRPQRVLILQPNHVLAKCLFPYAPLLNVIILTVHSGAQAWKATGHQLSDFLPSYERDNAKKLQHYIDSYGLAEFESA